MRRKVPTAAELLTEDNRRRLARYLRKRALGKLAREIMERFDLLAECIARPQPSKRQLLERALLLADSLARLEEQTDRAKQAILRRFSALTDPTFDPRTLRSLGATTPELMAGHVRNFLGVAKSVFGRMVRDQLSRWVRSTAPDAESGLLQLFDNGARLVQEALRSPARDAAAVMGAMQEIRSVASELVNAVGKIQPAAPTRTPPAPARRTSNLTPDQQLELLSKAVNVMGQTVERAKAGVGRATDQLLADTKRKAGAGR